MAQRPTKNTSNTPVPTLRPKASVDIVPAGDTVLVSVSGLVDEQFSGFKDLGTGVKTVIINVSGMTRMTSFGVRQWLKGMDALPKTITDLYLLGCPTFFVDQLNMVLNFGGAAQILTVLAPYTCAGCGVESGETIDVLAERATLAKGGVSEKECARCGGKLEFDETPESYFSFVNKYAASSIQPSAAQLLASLNLYETTGGITEKPPRIIKIVHGSVTYFRIIGTIGSMFRARPFLVGAEGEVVIDLAEVDRFDAEGQREWRRLLKSLSTQVPAVTLVDVNEVFLTASADSITLAKIISVWSVLVPYGCADCGRRTFESERLEPLGWPPTFNDRVCPTCGGASRNELRPEVFTPLQKAATSTPPASAKMIDQRDEVLSRALTDANVAQAGDNATANLSADDTILGKYKIVRRLSAGGMAEVFLAKQVGIGGFEKPVALKRIQRQLLETRHLAVDLFLNEAKIAGRLVHPNIVQVHDVGEVGGALYLAMEYVNGRDLRDVVKKLRANRTIMPLGEACYVVREVAQALHHAYWSTDLAGNQLSVVHRDVSPHNIILSYDGAVKLLDFGVAMSSVTEQPETMIVGKWLYMSPEHTTNQQVDHRSDLFSLGVILYLLTTGNMPFSGTNPKEIVRKVRAGQYKRIQESAPDLPEGFATLVDRLLSPRPEDRPQTGNEIVAALTEFTRNYGIQASAANISQFLSQLFADEIAAGRDSARNIEVPRVGDDKSPSPSPGSQSGSTSMASMPKFTPTGPFSVDVSVSLARRSHEFSSPVMKQDPSFTNLPVAQPSDISGGMPRQDVSQPFGKQDDPGPAPGPASLPMDPSQLRSSNTPIIITIVALAIVALVLVGYLLSR